MTLLSRLPKPVMPGPRGWRRTLLTGSCPPFKVAEPRMVGRLGTGGAEFPPPKGLPLENRDPKPAETRREGEAMVA